jgi:hypothetical protein
MAKNSQLEEHESRIRYLRHRLQMGFDVVGHAPKQAPKDENMADMSEYLGQLEAHQTLEAEVITKTKIHKVLKAIIRLESIPKEEEYAFKRRSNDLLRSWGDALSADPDLQRRVLRGVPEKKEEDKKIMRNMNGRLVYNDNDPWDITLGGKLGDDDMLFADYGDGLINCNTLEATMEELLSTEGRFV